MCKTHWQRPNFYIGYFIFLILLSGCAAGRQPNATADKPTTSPDAIVVTRLTFSATSTTMPLSTATLTPTKANSPNTVAETNLPLDTTSSTPTPDISNQPDLESTDIPTEQVVTSQPLEPQEQLNGCVDTNLLFTPSEGATVRWRHDDGGTLYCCYSSSSILQINRNPDASSNQVVFSILVESGRPATTTNVLFDFSTGTYKILGKDYENQKINFGWLPGEQVVWLDAEGEVFIGSFDNRETLNTPAKMVDLWLIASDRVLTRDESLRFWYLDLADLAWTQLPEEESQKLTPNWAWFVKASDDGDYVFFFYQNYVAILFNDSQEIRVIHPETPFLTIGAEPTGWDTPQQIKETSYWFLPSLWLVRSISETTNLPLEISGVTTYPALGVIVDSGTGAAIGHEILGIPPELAIYTTNLSPDRVWVAVEVVEGMEDYPAEVSQTWFISLSSGETRIEEGEFRGWDIESDAYLDALLPCKEQEIMIDLVPAAEE